MKTNRTHEEWLALGQYRWQTILSGVQRRFDPNGRVYYRARQGKHYVPCDTLTEAKDAREMLVSFAKTRKLPQPK